MPLPSDEKLIALSENLLQQFNTIFGSHPGVRPAHARGLLVSGTFTPAPGAEKLTNAPHITRPFTPVWARFSSSTGLPLVPDTDPNSNPRGLAIRFHLADHVHTDIISHSTDGFPTRTGDEFLEFLKALVASNGVTEHPTPIEAFLGAHPKALAFVQTPKPSPVSFATEGYFGVTAFQFTNAEGVVRYGRYRITPEAGLAHVPDAELAGKDANYLFNEVPERLSAGPIRFRISVQVANDGDIVDDATEHWPEDRAIVDLGTVELTAVVPENEKETKHVIFDPIPRVEGIEPSNDPLLELRAAIYLISGRRRRAA